MWLLHGTALAGERGCVLWGGCPDPSHPAGTSHMYTVLSADRFMCFLAVRYISSLPLRVCAFPFGPSLVLFGPFFCSCFVDAPARWTLVRPGTGPRSDKTLKSTTVAPMHASPTTAPAVDTLLLTSPAPPTPSTHWFISLAAGERSGFGQM